MSTSSCTLTGSWPATGGETVTGSIVVQPVSVATTSGSIIPTKPVTIPLADGAVSKALAYIAGETQWLIVEKLDDTDNVTPYVVTPTGPTLDLSTASRSAPAVPPPAPLFVLASAGGQPGGYATLDGGGHVPIAQIPSGGGGGFVPTIQQRSITTGAVTPPNTASAWVQLHQADATPFENAVAATVGDWVECAISQAVISDSPETFYDIGVMVGATIVRFLSAPESSMSTPAPQGDPSMYHGGGGFIGYGTGSSRGFTVTSGDLDGGIVRFALVVNSNNTGTLDAVPDYPFKWCARNLGPHTT